MGGSLPGNSRETVRVAFTAAVGSHLDTAYHIERALREGARDVSVTVIDVIGFSPWDAHHVPYAGDAARVAFSLRTAASVARASIRPRGRAFGTVRRGCWVKSIQTSS